MRDTLDAARDPSHRRWPFAIVAAALDELFELPDIAAPRWSSFWPTSAAASAMAGSSFGPCRATGPRVAADLAAWLDRLLASDAFTDILTDPAMPERAALWIPSIAGLRGRLNSGMFGG